MRNKEAADLIVSLGAFLREHRSEVHRVLHYFVQQDRKFLLSSDLLEGLDFLLMEMGKRKMTAVVCLNNFWPWSGGFAQYHRWFGGAEIPYPPPAEGGSWFTFARYSSRFYKNKAKRFNLLLGKWRVVLIVQIKN